VAVLTNAIAFNFLLCLFPLLLALVAVAEHFGGSRGGRALLALLAELIPFDQGALLQSVRTFSRMARSLEVLSLVLIVWGSSGIFIPVEMVLNRVWGQGPPRSFWKSRGLAFLMTVAGGLVVLVSIALTISVRSYGRQWPAVTAWTAKATAFLLTYALFFLVYRVIPAVRVSTVVAARAALWSAVVWEAAKYGFVVRLARMNLKAFYGPLAFAVSLVLWAFLSSLVLVFGALMSPASVPRRKKGAH
jgi:membrane protein